MARASSRRAVAVSVTLRPFVLADGDWLDEWLPAIAASVGYDELASLASSALRERLARDATVRARIIGRDGLPVGVVVCRVDAPVAGAAIIELIATPPSEARSGAGMKAAALVESEMLAAGVRRIYAPAPEIHGIAMYFWVRLGYHPLLRPAWPCERDGVAWLVREVG